MRNIIFTLAFLLTSVTQAAIVDNFVCKITIEDFNSGIVSTQSMETSAGRKPEVPGDPIDPPYPGDPTEPIPMPNPEHAPPPSYYYTTYAQTSGNSKLESNSYEMSVFFNLNYQHSTNPGIEPASSDAGRPFPGLAQQTMCFSIGHSYCNLDQGPNSACSAMGTGNSCTTSTDVPVINGVPVFDPIHLTEQQGLIYDDNGPQPGDQGHPGDHGQYDGPEHNPVASYSVRCDFLDTTL